MYRTFKNFLAWPLYVYMVYYFVREINCLFTTQFTFFFSAVQEKYRKSSVTKQIKNKFSSSLINKKKSDQIGNNHPGVDVVGSNNSMSKFRSHSHGALPSLDEFTKTTGLLSFYFSVKKSTVCLQPSGKRNWSNM